MLRSIKSLHGCTVAARDGDIGSVDDVFFDDKAWGVRYLVVDTGNWMRERQVLISPYSIKRVDGDSGTVHVHLTRQQARDSPNIDTHKPVSRQHETEYLLYYGYPTYWGGPNLWGMGAYPAIDVTGQLSGTASQARPPPDLEPHQPPVDAHLQSANAVEGYHVEAADGSIGHVCGFIFDDVAWVIRYLIVDTRSWWPGGKEVLLATQWIDSVDWSGSTVSTSLARDAVKNSPEYDGSVPLSPSYETTLHKFYGKAGYWSGNGGDVEVFEKVGTRGFSATLTPDATVVLKEGTKEVTRLTLNCALSALAEQTYGPAILESTVGQLLRALIRKYAVEM